MCQQPFLEACTYSTHACRENSFVDNMTTCHHTFGHAKVKKKKKKSVKGRYISSNCAQTFILFTRDSKQDFVMYHTSKK